MRIAICEDNVLHQALIRSCIEAYPIKQVYSLDTYLSGESFLDAFESGLTYDILFIDVKMHAMDGYETAKAIRKTDSEIVIIFTTSLIQYAIEGYGIGVNEFLLKPIEQTIFNKTLTRVLKVIHKQEKNQYIINCKDNTIALKVDDIYYVESVNRKIIFYTDDDTYEQYGSMKEAEAKLKVYGFNRVHRSYLVNMKQILKINSKEIILRNNQTIPLSQGRYTEIYNDFTRYISGRV